MDPKVSVCIPTCNGERYIVEAIRSVLAQSFTDFEVIITDDQSTDSTVETIRSLQNTCIVLYENKERLGIPGNWNRALSLARGEYVCIFHQDDRMQPDNLARKVHVLDADPTVGFVHSAVEVLVEPSAPYPPAQWVEDSSNDFVVNGYVYLRRLLLEGNLICAPAVLARRQDLLDAGGFDTDLGFACDYALWMKLCLDRRVAFLNQPLVQYRWHADNETHRYRFAKGIRESWVAGQKVLAEYRQRPGREQEAELLWASVNVLTRERQWAAELETGKAWLEGQVQQWQQEAERRGQTVKELQDWIAQLETGKAWLEGQVQQWQQEARQRERAIADLQVGVAQLETGKAWLEGQVQHWQQEAERRGQTVKELQDWIAQLETGKAWLEGQVQQWQQEAERRGQTVKELQDWIAQLETGKAWLEGQVQQWQQEAERRSLGIIRGEVHDG